MSETKGATAVEYGILVAMMALVMIVGMGSFGNAMNTLFSDNNSELQKAFD